MTSDRFTIGARVRVRSLAVLGHVRTPDYLRGHTGTIERVLGPFANPEALAYGNRADRPVAERLPLYRVRFAMADLWGNGSADLLEAEIYSHWLEPADAA